MQPKISLCASAMRTPYWKRMYESLKGNRVPFEIVFVGPIKPDFPLPDNFKFIYSTVKPAQCYEIAFRNATGELVFWTTDDSTYTLNREDNIDRICEFYDSFKTDKLVVAMRPIEDGGDVYKTHHFFGKWHHTPYMAPFGVMSRKLLMDLGGYDRKFVCGQAENDMVMRVYELGGRCELCMDAYVEVHHVEVHQGARHEFRKWYPEDRKRLEECWVKQGYGAMGDNREMMFEPEISKTRLRPVESFPQETIMTISEEPKGSWK